MIEQVGVEYLDDLLQISIVTLFRLNEFVDCLNVSELFSTEAFSAGIPKAYIRLSMDQNMGKIEETRNLCTRDILPGTAQWE